MTAFLTAASTAIGIVRQLQAGAAAKASAEARAELLRRQSIIAQQRARVAEHRTRILGARRQGSLRARMAGAGVDLASGSAVLIQDELAGEAELEALLARSDGEIAAHDAQARQAIQLFEGRQRQTSALLGATSTLLRAAGKATQNSDQN